MTVPSPQRLTILVTGGAGFIGSHTIIELIKHHRIIIVDDLSNAHSDVICRLEAHSRTKVDFHQVSITDQEAMDRVFSYYNGDTRLPEGYFIQSPIDIVIHFAAFKSVNESHAQPLKYYHNNVHGTLTLLQMMQKYNVKKLIFSSSAVVYGLPKVTEMVAETIAKGPITSPYGRSKLMCEQMMEDLCHSEKGWKIASLRYFNPVGAHPAGIIGENPRGIPNNLMPFVAQVAATNIPASYSLTRKWSKTRILSVFGNDYPTPDGTGVRDYIHVCDLARGHVDALHWILSLKGHQSVYRPFNLGCGQGHSVLDVIETFEKVNQVKVPYRFTARRNGDVPKLVANPARANQELGFKCTKTLEDMCRDMWRWQRTLMRETEYELEE